MDLLVAYFIEHSLELFAAFFGILNVYMSTKEMPAAWPVSLLSVGPYIVVYYNAGLFSDALLHVFYVLMSLYGWWNWSLGKDRNKENEDIPLLVRKISSFQAILLFSIASIGTLALGLYFSRIPEAAMPYWDAATTSFSIVATYMLAKKYIENWYAWICIDIICVGIYLIKGLYATAVLYGIFTVLAYYGVKEWQRSMHKETSLIDPLDL